ncbi:MAG: hypothetical protein RPT25_08820 [Cycloclasticus sp.]|jgi:hypothetical protein
MLKEIALNPLLMADVESVKQLSAGLDYESGRLVASCPSNWTILALKAIKESQHRPLTKETLKVKLKALQRNLVKNVNRKHIWDLEKEPWDKNATGAHRELPFSVVIVKQGNMNESPYYSPDEIFLNSPEEWNTVISKQVERKKVEIVKSVMPLVNLSDRILLVDPFFDISDANYRDTLVELLKQLNQSSSLRKVEIHIASTQSEQKIERDLANYTSPVMLLGITVEFIVWNIKSFHDRFALTDVGAFSYGHGFAERDRQGSTHVLVQRVGKDAYGQLWLKFNDLENIRFRKSV